jgi:uncharacterized iron-regulated membrane protein
MNGFAGRWLRQPQRVWLRRALFQVHLWTGLAMGLYVVVLSLSGSVLVYRVELDQWLSTPHAAFDATATPRSLDALRSAAQRAYPDWQLTAFHEGNYKARASGRPGRRAPDPTALAVFERAGETKERLFNPYTGADLGDNWTSGQAFVAWLVRLHDELLMQQPDGQWWNGLLSLVFTVSVLTGAVVWWPGLARWKRSLGVHRGVGWRRLNWDLHSAMGFWLFLFMLMWGVSGWYLGMPEPLTNFNDWISSPAEFDGERPGDVALAWLARLHFGRWRDPDWGPWLKATWALVGVAPAAMAVTGTLMWWNRVVRRAKAKREAAYEANSI